MRRFGYTFTALLLALTVLIASGCSFIPNVDIGSLVGDFEDITVEEDSDLGILKDILENIGGDRLKGKLSDLGGLLDDAGGLAGFFGESGDGTGDEADEALSDGLKDMAGVDVGDDWPDNEYTRQIPRGYFGGQKIMSSDNGVAIVSTASSVTDARGYVIALKNAGFTANASESDRNVAGMDIYTYSADNSQGYRVNVSFTAGVLSVSVSRAD